MRVICGAAVLLVFAEEVSVRVICVAAVIVVFAEEVSVRVICAAAAVFVLVLQRRCLCESVSRQSVPQKCARVPNRSVLQKCQARLPHKSVK